MGIKIVPRHGNTLKEKLYLPAIFGGMKTTLSHLITNLGDAPDIKPAKQMAENQKKQRRKDEARHSNKERGEKDNGAVRPFASHKRRD